MNGSSHPDHEKLEGMTGTRNRLLRARGGVFEVTEAPRGRLSGSGTGHRNSEIGTSR